MFQENDNKQQKDTKEQSETEIKQIVHQKPLTCLFDLDERISKRFINQSYCCTQGSLGSYIRVPNNKRGDQKFLQPDYSFPDNLHEYDIVVFDMNIDKEIEYSSKDFRLENVSGRETHALLSEFPQKIFNPRPYVLDLLSNSIDSLLKKESIIVVFASNHEVVEYKPVTITPIYNQPHGSILIPNTKFYNSFPPCFNKKGLKFKLLETQISLMAILSKYTSQAYYELVFRHPKLWNKQNKREQDSSFIPLILNDDNEIVAFYHDHGNNGGVFVFPQINNKEDFLLEFFNSYLAETFPSIFPYHGQFGWLDDGSYPLPEERELRSQRGNIERQYLADISANDQELAKIKENYQFLRDLISESGDKLVKAVEYYFKWLGFASVINVDDMNPEIREEDLQVDCGDRFLVVEIKGIGGTSTDDDCSQISKIKYRRAEQRRKFDVFGLYIVNHQRYRTPKERNNPPFSENQINDAKLAERGLLTTYELFNAYFLIEKGILKKEDVQNQLFGIGLIKLQPDNLKSLGIPTEFCCKGHGAILKLDGAITLKKGDIVIARKGNDFEKLNILSLQNYDKDVEEANLGEVGVRFDKKIREKTEFYVEQI